MADETVRNAIILQQRAVCALLLIRKRRNKRRRSIWVREVFSDRPTDGDYHNLIPKLRQAWITRRDSLYVETFRLIPPQFDFLLSLVEPLLTKQTTHLRQSISAEERLYMTLRYLVTGDQYRSISLAFRVGKSTVSEIVVETTKAIWVALQPLYVQPPDKNRLRQIAEEFNQRWNFPHCIGAIDGKHISLVAPPNGGSSFYNYKGFHSIVLMAACDAAYNFTFIDIGNYGRISDGGVFAASPLGQQLETSTFCPAPALIHSHEVLPFCFVGDDAFPLKENIMKPYPGKNLAQDKRIFNYRLSRARRCIENAFGILASRWRVLRKPLYLLPENAEVVVKATICLHNFLLSKDGDLRSHMYCPTGFADFCDVQGNICEGEWRREGLGSGIVSISQQGSNRHGKTAAAIRDSFCKYFSGAGAVPWQGNK